MKLAFWKKAPVVSSECTHLWSNWSEPGACRVTLQTLWSTDSTERDGWAQDRHCMQCNRYERRWA